MTHLLTEYDYATGRYVATWQGAEVASAQSIVALARVTLGLEKTLQRTEADKEN